jgi:hypothetical protein
MNARNRQHNALKTYIRTRYFYGQLLDVQHFESEQRYFNEKRWLLNRLIAGYGVVCGLNVRPAKEGRVEVMPGVAIDRTGREIILPRSATSEQIPKAEPRDGAEPDYDAHCDPKNWVHVSVCYHECLARPERVAIPECDATPECESGEVHERYEIVIEEGKADAPDLERSIRDALVGGRLHYDELVRRVSECCPALEGSICVPLANVRKPEGDAPIPAKNIDITIRPIVYTNDLLFELIYNLTTNDNHRRNGNG